MNILTGIAIVVCGIHAAWALIKILFLESSDSVSFYNNICEIEFRLINFFAAIFYCILIFILVLSLN